MINPVIQLSKWQIPEMYLSTDSVCLCDLRCWSQEPCNHFRAGKRGILHSVLNRMTFFLFEISLIYPHFGFRTHLTSHNFLPGKKKLQIMGGSWSLERFVWHVLWLSFKKHCSKIFFLLFWRVWSVLKTRCIFFFLRTLFPFLYASMCRIHLLKRFTSKT